MTNLLVWDVLRPFTMKKHNARLTGTVLSVFSWGRHLDILSLFIRFWPPLSPPDSIYWYSRGFRVVDCPVWFGLRFGLITTVSGRVRSTLVPWSLTNTPFTIIGCLLSKYKPYPLQQTQHYPGIGHPTSPLF